MTTDRLRIDILKNKWQEAGNKQMVTISNSDD